MVAFVRTEPTLRALLADIRADLAIQRDLLARLVAIEEERREGERRIQELADALRAHAPIDVDALDWFRTSSGDFGIRDGLVHRAATTAEAAAIEASLNARRETRR